MPTVDILVSGEPVAFDVYGNTDDALADALTYLAGQSEASAFLAADANQQAIWIVSMTRLLDRQTWQGSVTDGYGQIHAWPRAGLFYPGAPPVAVNPLDVPQQVIDACFEGAAQLAAGSSIQDAANTFPNQRMIKAGSVAVEYFRELGPFPRFGPIIQELIGYWLGGGGNFPSAISTGTSGKSEAKRNFDFSRGF
jgi:hypothetical protein